MKKWLWPLAVVIIFPLVPYECFIDKNVFNEFMIAVYMLRGLIVIFALYFAIMWLYSLLRKNFDKKYGAEILVIFSVLVFSVVGKVLAIIMDVDDDGKISVDLPKDGWQAVAAMYYSLYQAIGGLSFEGLANYEYYESWRTIIYAGGSVLTGLVAISIITFSISYEIYSTVSWLTTRKRNSKIYVFTAVTEDSVILAHSIADHHAELKKSGKKQKYQIIFLRTEGQEGFDSKNPLHLDIMHSGFLFMSYSPGRKNKSIPEFLHIKVKNDRCLHESKLSPREEENIIKGKVGEVHIFALDWKNGETVENDKVVCEDVARVTSRLFSKKLTVMQRIRLRFKRNKNGYGTLSPQFMLKLKDFGMIINYHFLVEEEIDIANVDMRFENEVAKLAPEGKAYSGAKTLSDTETIGSLAMKVLCDKSSDEEKKVFMHYKQHFVFDALSEANMAAFSYVRKKAALIEECSELCASDVSRDEYRALVIGFGQNGQQTMKSAYIYASAGKHDLPLKLGAENKYFPTDKDDKQPEWTKTLQKSKCVEYAPQPFIADVYDRNASEVGGLFRMKHPSIRVVMPQCKSLPYKYKFAPVEVILHHESAYSDRILTMLDDELGKSGKNVYNLIIIALGDDDSNVSIANAILEDRKHELLMPKEQKKDEDKDASKKESKNENYQIIAINLRNRLNYDRINWTEKDEERFEHVKVIRFGSSEEMYSYENIVDISLAKKWNYGYNVISTQRPNSNKTQNTVDILREAIHNVVLKDNASDGKDDEDKDNKANVEKLSKDLKDRMRDDVAAENLWYTLGGKAEMYYLRLSSRYACEMPAYIKGYCVARGFCKEGEYEKVSIKNMIKLGAVEHDRWVRFLVSYGFKPGEKKELYFKEHPCITDYKYLNSQHNDMMNVINALLTDKNRG